LDLLHTVLSDARPRGVNQRRRTGLGRAAVALAGGILAASITPVAGCSQTFDAGSSRPHGPLPVDARNPIVLLNDGPSDNWQGEYALLLANGGGPRVAGIVVSSSPPWPDLQENVDGWRKMVAAARASGLDGIPDPIASVGQPLTPPASREIAATTPNRSEGALFIVEASRRLSLPYRPLVVVTGGRLTDVADAYLVDPTVAERIVVVSSLGSVSDAAGGAMGIPNGEMDQWASTIVATRLRYVQVSAYYDQLTDVPTSRVAELPDNPLGAWIAGKQSQIWSTWVAADQVAVIAVALPAFAVNVERVAAVASSDGGTATGPNLLVANPSGPAWLVRESESSVATARFWELLAATAKR
jgi:hypothetical protein